MVAIRVPGLRWYAELEFLYDTGSCMMSLFEGDLQTIMGTSTNEPPVMGLLASTIADGSTMVGPAIELEVTILDNQRRRMTKWVRVQCQVYRGWCSQADHRLDGPWLRQMLYTGSAPRDEDTMWIANTHAELVRGIPDTGHSRRLPAVVPGTIPLNPGGRASLMPRGRPGAGAMPPAILHRKMPRVAPR